MTKSVPEGQLSRMSNSRSRLADNIAVAPTSFPGWNAGWSLRVVRAAGGALLLLAGLHGQLLRTEWAQEKARLLKLIMATLLGFVCLLGLMAALGALLLALYWDTPYRIPAVSALIALHGLGGFFA